MKSLVLVSTLLSAVSCTPTRAKNASDAEAYGRALDVCVQNSYTYQQYEQCAVAVDRIWGRK